MRIFSWNVNGLRAVVKKGFFDWLESEGPDVVCLQEIKARTEDLDEKYSIQRVITHSGTPRRERAIAVLLYLQKKNQ